MSSSPISSHIASSSHVVSISSSNSYIVNNRQNAVTPIENISFERFIALKPLDESDDAQLAKYHVIKESAILPFCSYFSVVLGVVLLASIFLFEIKKPLHIVSLFLGKMGLEMLSKYVDERRAKEIARIAHNREIIAENLLRKYSELTKGFILKFIGDIQLPSNLIKSGYTIEEINSLGYNFQKEVIREKKKNVIETINKIKEVIEINTKNLSIKRIPQDKVDLLSKLMKDFVDFFLKEDGDICDTNPFYLFYVQTEFGLERDCINRINQFRQDQINEARRNFQSRLNDDTAVRPVVPLSIVVPEDSEKNPVQFLDTRRIDMKESKANPLRSISSEETNSTKVNNSITDCSITMNVDSLPGLVNGSSSQQTSHSSGSNLTIGGRRNNYLI